MSGNAPVATAVTAPLAPPATAVPAAGAGTAAGTRRWWVFGQFVALTLIYTALAVVFTWPLAAHLREGLVSPLDPLDSVWRVAQGQRQLLQNPGDLLDANIFYPYAHTYLFDELLLGAALLTLPLQLFTANPVLIYNVAVLMTF